MTTLKGKVSWFGGPDDTGVDPDEGLAFYYEVSDAPELFLDQQPPGTTGLARRLDPEQFYIATRWDYELTPKDMLPHMLVLVRNARTGASVSARPADWGPHIDTDRCADVSPGVMAALGLSTDDEVIIEYQPLEEVTMPYESIVISSGHGQKIRGAAGVLDEVDEARRVVERVADKLEARGVEVYVFHDNTSTTQSENLECIVSAHNARDRQLDVSVHFNAYQPTDKKMGVECLFITQDELAADLSGAMAEVMMLPDRGAKKRTDLYFLNNTDEPAVLLEVAFVDSTADAAAYEENFDAVCEAIATVLGGPAEEVELPPGEERPPLPERPHHPATVRLDIEVTGNVTVIINGVPVS
jgi:N-acetylmuramoyl-L-alanine amidase